MLTFKLHAVLYISIAIVLCVPTCSVCHSFIRIDGLVEVTSVEEILQQLLHFRNASGAANEDDVMDGWLVHLGITKSLLHRFQGAAEQVGIQLLKPGTSDRRIEVDAFKQRVDLDVCLKPITKTRKRL